MSKDCDGWLSPEGELIKCDMAAHLRLAGLIVEDRYPEQHCIKNRPDEILIRHNWIKKCSSENGTMGYGWFPMTPLTQAQLDFIYDWSTERGFWIPDYIKEAEII